MLGPIAPYGGLLSPHQSHVAGGGTTRSRRGRASEVLRLRGRTEGGPGIAAASGREGSLRRGSPRSIWIDLDIGRMLLIRLPLVLLRLPLLLLRVHDRGEDVGGSGTCTTVTLGVVWLQHLSAERHGLPPDGFGHCDDDRAVDGADETGE
jgi:hypothetical protein